LAYDFTAHDAMKMALQRRNSCADIRHLGIGHDAHLGAFEGDRVTSVTTGADAIHAEELARHMKAGDLIPAIERIDARFKVAKPNGVYRGKRIAIAVQGLAFLYHATGGDNVFDLAHLFGRKPYR